MRRAGGTGVAAALVALAAVLVGCADAPLRPAPVAVERPPPAPAEIARDDDFVIVRLAAGESAATLAQRHLGDAARAFWILEANGGVPPAAGDVVVVPLRPPNPLGVEPGGYQAIPILCYHRFGSRASPLTVTPAAFEAQMDYLARNGYTVVPVARLAGFLSGREPLPRKTVAISIDDGYRSTFDIAFPVLTRHRFPATLYLYSDFVGAGDALNWAQMRQMQVSGLVDVQPHSKTHANLTQKQPGETDAQYRDRLRREVDAPIAAIRDRLGTASATFAYPYGDVNDAVIAELRRRDVPAGVTVTPGGNGFFAYPYYLRRSMVYGTDSIDAFKAKLVTFVPLAGRN